MRSREGVTPLDAAELVLPRDLWQEQAVKDRRITKPSVLRLVVAYGWSAAWRSNQRMPDGSLNLSGPLRPVWVSQKELAKRTGLLERTISDAQGDLQELGYLTPCDVPAFVAAGWRALSGVPRAHVFVLTRPLSQSIVPAAPPPDRRPSWGAHVRHHVIEGKRPGKFCAYCAGVTSDG